MVACLGLWVVFVWFVGSWCFVLFVLGYEFYSLRVRLLSGLLWVLGCLVWFDLGGIGLGLLCFMVLCVYDLDYVCLLVGW